MTLRIGSVFGVDIKLHVSVVVIFILITVSLGTSVLAEWHPEWSPSGRWGAALTAAVLFFMSLLVHELAHALMARRRGVAITGITLFLLGGMAEMQNEPSTPKDELIIAGAGPLASLGLALLFAVFVGLTLQTPEALTDAENPTINLSSMSFVATIAIWLATINLVLGLFNLIPGFPMDGGRLFRALLWWRTGDFIAATKQAAKVGALFGSFLVVFGGLRIIAGDLANGIWLVLMGWFINRLAHASADHQIRERALRQFDVGTIMRTRFETVPHDVTVEEFITDYLLRSSQVTWPVVREGQDVGFVTQQDVTPRRPTLDPRTVGDCMRPIEQDNTLGCETGARDAFDVLSDQTTPVPVVDRNGRIVGIIHHADILRWLSLH